MSLIFWDTMLFVYLLEDNPTFAGRVRAVRTRMLERGDRLCTGALTIGELLAGPYMDADAELIERHKAVLRPPLVEVVNFDAVAAEHYARIRIDKSIARPDAMQLACAAAAKVDLFLTNDNRLKRKIVHGIQFIAGLDSDVL